MKLSVALAALAPFLATDAKPEEVTAALIAADAKAKDKKGKDTAYGDPESEDQPKAGDKAKDGAAAEVTEKDKDTGGADEDPDMEMDEDPEAAEGGAPKPKMDKKGKDKAMDSATVTRLIAANDAKHAAAREVETILGVVSYDSAEGYYRAALTKLGVDTVGVHASALRPMLKLAKDAARPAPADIAQDSAVTSEFLKAIPALARRR